MTRACIFNIQKFSIHDGPGIRTAVFFKACPLRCKWCSNPESQNGKVQVLRDEEKCLHCGACVELCPRKALSIQGNGRISTDAALCSACLACVNACPAEALSPEGQEYTIGEVLETCLEDRPFYEESGGGVTLTGGEVFSQADFALEFLRALKKEHIHRAIETSAYTERTVFMAMTEETELILFDVKHHDREKHREGTGVYNDIILQNLKAALDAGLNVLPRIPVIPGYNDAMEDAAAFAALLSSLGAKEAQLLPFHQLGENKYRLLGIPYSMEQVRPLHGEDMEEYAEIFRTRGIRCFF